MGNTAFLITLPVSPRNKLNYTRTAYRTKELVYRNELMLQAQPVLLEHWAGAMCHTICVLDIPRTN